MRECRKCGETKPLEEFILVKSCLEGRSYKCRDCNRRLANAWAKENREKRRININKRNRDRKKMAVDHFGDKCHDCGQTFPQCVYEFHHLDPSKKDYHPSQTMTQTEERMWKELEKCIMLCSNCHKIRHWA